MANPSKQRGTRWETAVTDYLRANGFPHAERRTLSGAADRGDINAGPGLVIECKSQARHSLAEWVDETELEKRNAGADVGFAWIHRRGFASPAKGYVVMTGEQAVQLLRAAGYGDPMDPTTQGATR
ncbi:MAG: hypothetical protein Q4F65_12955 [Propionibacteriaceae bacterium]|nr:hypothetical protein [Propionibacteriaceae bacterium]